MKHDIQGYYFITDSALSLAGSRSDTRSAVKAEAVMVQYRQKDACTKDMLLEARALRNISGKALFIVNDRIDIALACAADGVHIGQDDMPLGYARKLLGKRAVIGVTVHNMKEAALAAKGGADYLAVSPIFKTGTKKDAGKPVGLKLITKVKKTFRLPVAAIGGINHSNAALVAQAGADLVCAISCVVASPDPAKEIKRLLAIIK